MSQPAKNSNQAAVLSGMRSGKSAANAASAEAAYQNGAAALAGLIPAAFTERELFQLRNACRDSDNENASRYLEAALARAGGKS